MKRIKKGYILLLVIAAAAFFVGYSTAPTQAFPEPFNRGYFHNIFDDSPRDLVWPSTGGAANTPAGTCQGDGWAIPGWVDTAEELINFTFCKLWGSTREHVGAAMIISTMTGQKDINPTWEHFLEWAARIRYAESRGWINFGAVEFCNPNSPYINTFYQPEQQDVAAYRGCGSNIPNVITFRDDAGIKYILKRFCSNPLGEMLPLIDFNVTGYTTVSNATPAPGSTITFTHYLRNQGPTSTSPYAIWWIAERTEASPATIVGGPAPYGVLQGDNQPVQVYVDTVPIPANTPHGTQFCERVGWDPVNDHGGRNGRGTPVCATVQQPLTMPYTRAYGGDLSAGNPLASGNQCTATTNSNAAVVGWNRRDGGGWAGAGAQYAIYAANRITDFSTTLGNGGGAAPAPNGLAFANTSGSAGSGWFGGQFGTLPCIPDFYGKRPSSIPPPPTPTNVNSMTSGSYFVNGQINGLSGTVRTVNGAHQRVVLYVNGNVFINNNIQYPAGTWGINNVPFFQLVVNGNIYINSSVSRLDGIYIAQADSNGNGGQIHTCATGMAALPLGGSTFTTCNNKLTVNGLFVANSVRLLRTNGTYTTSNATEAGTSANIAEVFNFGPAIWLNQPDPTEATPWPDYDAIISLPPIL